MLRRQLWPAEPAWPLSIHSTDLELRTPGKLRARTGILWVLWPMVARRTQHPVDFLIFLILLTAPTVLHVHGVLRDEGRMKRPQKVARLNLQALS